MDYPDGSAISSENQALPESPADDGIGVVLQSPRTMRRLRALLPELERSKKCDVSSDATWYLHGLIRAVHRAVITRVENVWPCEKCGRPVCALRAFSGTDVSIVDAK